MRATINFDIDLDKVEDTMATLVSQEAATLHITANILDNLGHGPLLQEVTEALDLLRETTSQLQQYKDMLISFEQARYKTMVPQDTVQSMGDVATTLANIDKFGNFIDRLNKTADEGNLDEAPTTEEG